MADGIRLDKWLWAARFFKTRNLAKQAIEGGKVHGEDGRAKPSLEVRVGQQLWIRQGFDEKAVIVLGLSEQRRGAPEAALLYRETPESEAARQLQAERRRMQSAGPDMPMGRPSKRDRRQIRHFKEQHGS